MANKLLNYAALGIAGLGILLSILLGALVYMAIDGVEKIAITQFNDIIKTLGDVESSVARLSEGVQNTSEAFGDIEKGMENISAAIDSAGDEVISFGSSIKGLSLGIISFADEGDALITAGQKLKGSASSFSDAKEKIHMQTGTIEKFSEDLSKIKDDIGKQKQDIKKAKKEFVNAMGNLKLASIVLALLFMSLFIGIAMNSLAVIV